MVDSYPLHGRVVIVVAAADALENEGDVTDVVETDNGLYVARLTSLLDREATDTEKENIVEERRQDQYDSLLEEWRDGTEIDVKEKVWRKVDFEDLGVTITTSEDESTDEGTTEENGTDSGEETTGDTGETADETDSGQAVE